MGKQTGCKHFEAATVDGVCMTCEREQDDQVRAPLASFAGGRENWRSGPTIGESMRDNRAHWAETKVEPQYVGPSRKRSLSVNRHFQ